MSISIIMGSMFSGKTSELLVKLERAYIAKKKVVLLRPGVDNRGFLAHNGKKLNGFKEIFVEDLDQFDATDYEVIGIDEGQFHKHLKDFCVRESLKGKNIFISALHATSESEMFEEIIKIMPYCEFIYKLNAICTHCGSEEGNYTFYKDGKKTEKIVVGGADAYTALCQKCYFEEMTQR